MIKLALISDTHWSSWNLADPLVRQLEKILQEGGYDQIWHAGDVTANAVLEQLETFAPVVCVKGNCDNFLGRRLPHSVTETLEQVKIAMIHGWDLPLDHAPTVLGRFPSDVSVIIHGHTHRRRFQETVDGGATIINPGSVSSPRGGETPGYGELQISGDQWEYRSFSL